MRILDKVKGLRSPYPAGLRWPDYIATRVATPLNAGQSTFFGKRIRYSDNVGFLHSVREIFADEVYRFEARTDAPYIIDAGANIGLSVLYFKRMYPKSTIIAFEPDVAIFAMLEHNVGGLDGVELRRQAAWIEETTLNFFTEGSLAGSSEIDFLNKGKKIEVEAIRLKNDLHNRHVDFLKIDIEGAENSVLFDIETELANVDHLFFEYHSIPNDDQRLGDMLNLVQRAGFRYIINGVHAPRLPFVEKVDRGFDLQLNVFCFRQ